MAALRPAITPLALPVWAADRVRLWWLRALGPLGRRLVRDRELRVALGGVLMILSSLALTVAVPIWLLALGPVVWGVPHVLSDVRYLVARPGLHRRWQLWLFAALPLLMLAITLDPGWGFTAAAAAAASARGPWWRKAPLVAGLCVLVTFAHRQPFLWVIVFAHVHNVVGLVIWWGWRRRRRWLHMAPLLLFVLANVLLLTGALDGAVIACRGLGASAGGMDYYFHLSVLAPGCDGALGARLILAFAFAQAVHYAVWMRLVPDEDRPRETPRTFAASLRALRADLGWPLVTLTVLGTIGVGIWAAIDLYAARNGYLRAAQFHGYLEVAAIAVLLVEGLKPLGAKRTT